MMGQTPQPGVAAPWLTGVWRASLPEGKGPSRLFSLAAMLGCLWPADTGWVLAPLRLLGGCTPGSAGVETRGDKQVPGESAHTQPRMDAA